MGCGRSGLTSGQSLKDVLAGGSVHKLRGVFDVCNGARDPNAPDPATGESPLVMAARIGATVEAFAVLLESGADPTRATGSDSRPLLALLTEWEDKEKARAVASALLQRGLDPNVGAEAPLLTALKACHGPLSEVLVRNSARIDIADADGNTPLHIAGAIADAAVVAAILERCKEADRTVKNSAGLSPVMCARLGAIAPKMRLSPDWKWCIPEVLSPDWKGYSKPEADGVTGQHLDVGEEVWRCPTGRAYSAASIRSPGFPRNHEVAANLALAAGDAYSLTDAIEGAWLDGEAPPEKPQNEVHPDIMKAIQTLVHVLQYELRKGLDSKDASRVEAGLEMLWYANVAKLPEEERAIKMLVRMNLDAALKSCQELELKQALLSATQYKQEASPLFKPAQEALDAILEERQIETLVQQLIVAREKKDFNSLHAVLQFGKSGKLKTGSLMDRPEYVEGQAFLEQAMRSELVQASTRADRKAVDLACARARHYSVTHLEECQVLYRLKKEEAVEALQGAKAKNTETAVQEALRAVLEDADLNFMGMQKEAAFQEALQSYRDLLSIPPAVEERQLVNILLQGRADVVRKQAGTELEKAFQELFDLTHSKVRTKDRRVGDLPRRLVVKEVTVIQNADNLIKYNRRRESIRKQYNPSQLGFLGDLRSAQKCKTFGCFSDGRQFQQVLKEADDMMGDVIDHKINEFYLFHGTSPEAAAAITEGDFRMDLAGTNAGTLYGRGLYFAESAMKSDEYAKQDARQLYPMLVCRVTLGHLHYTDEEYPNTTKLVQMCTRGSFHSVLGDREKCRGTFREIVVYDSDQAYPEFVVWYSRELA